jgi:hypothetical protein
VGGADRAAAIGDPDLGAEHGDEEQGGHGDQHEDQGAALLPAVDRLPPGAVVHRPTPRYSLRSPIIARITTR